MLMPKLIIGQQSTVHSCTVLAGHDLSTVLLVTHELHVNASCPCMTWLISAQGVSDDELLLEARSSLIRVAEKFDVSKNARLTSFAWFDIMNSLQRLVRSEGALLPMARSALQDLSKLDRAEVALAQQTGKDPSLNEVAAKVSKLSREWLLLQSDPPCNVWQQGSSI